MFGDGGDDGIGDTSSGDAQRPVDPGDRRGLIGILQLDVRSRQEADEARPTDRPSPRSSRSICTPTNGLRTSRLLPYSGRPAQPLIAAWWPAPAAPMSRSCCIG